MAVDLRLYALVDPEAAGGRDAGRSRAAACAGGATLVQLRDKHGRPGVMIETRRAIKAALEPQGVPLLINDRVDVALAAEADGVHVGQDDMPVADARRLLGRDAIIGLSDQERGAGEAAPLELLDYVGDRRRLCDRLRRTIPTADRRRRLATHRRRVRARAAGVSDLRHCRDRRGQCRGRDRRGRRRRRGDFGAVACAGSGRRRARTARRRSMRALARRRRS